MSSKSPEVLTPEQRLLFTTIPADLSPQEMAHYYTLHPEDVAFIQRYRKASNKLGIAMQLCTLRFPGRFLMHMTELPESMVAYVARQLDLPATVLAQYGQRQETPYNHLTEIRQQYSYRSCDEMDAIPLIRYLLPFAMENDEALPLVDQQFQLWQKGFIKGR